MLGTAQLPHPHVNKSHVSQAKQTPAFQPEESLSLFLFLFVIFVTILFSLLRNDVVVQHFHVPSTKTPILVYYTYFFIISLQLDNSIYII